VGDQRLQHGHRRRRVVQRPRHRGRSVPCPSYLVLLLPLSLPSPHPHLETRLLTLASLHTIGPQQLSTGRPRRLPRTGPPPSKRAPSSPRFPPFACSSSSSRRVKTGCEDGRGEGGPVLSLSLSRARFTCILIRIPHRRRRREESESRVLEQDEVVVAFNPGSFPAASSLTSSTAACREVRRPRSAARSSAKRSASSSPFLARARTLSLPPLAPAALAGLRPAQHLARGLGRALLSVSRPRTLRCADERRPPGSASGSLLLSLLLLPRR